MGAVQSIVELVALRPPTRPDEDPVLPIGAESTTIRARYSNVPVYTFYGSRSRGAGADASASVGTGSPLWIIYSHGSTEDCCTSLRFADALATKTGTNVVMYEYPGYGRSAPISTDALEEVPSEDGINAAAHATYQYIVDDKRVAPDQIVVMGWSIGSGPTMDLAASVSVAGAIVQSAFKSVVRTRCYTPWSCACDPFQNQDKASKIARDTRVLVMHGTDDALVPLSHGKQLHDALSKNTNVTSSAKWFKGKHHADLVLDTEYIATIVAFLDSIRCDASGISLEMASDEPLSLRQRTIAMHGGSGGVPQ